MQPNDPTSHGQALRQLSALRSASKRRADGRRSTAHNDWCRAAYVRHILQLRAYLRRV